MPRLKDALAMMDEDEMREPGMTNPIIRKRKKKKKKKKAIKHGSYFRKKQTAYDELLQEAYEE